MAHELEPHELEQHDLEPLAMELGATSRQLAATLNLASCQVVPQLVWAVEALQTHLAQLVVEA